MQFTIQPSKNLPSEAHIAELEAMLQSSLPASYRAFLKKYNNARLFPLEGSRASEDAFICIFAKPSDAYEPEWWSVRFTGLVVDGSAYDYGLLQEYEFMAGCGSHLPDLMAFADNSGGVKFHICVKGEYTGAIFMAGDRYTRCVNQGREPALKDYTQISENFDAFLAALRWVDYDRHGNEIVYP